MSGSSCKLQRRTLLRLGALSVLAPTTRSADAVAPSENDRGSTRSCIFMLLQGGPSHIDLWDPKPDAPQEVRGPFATIDTSLPGVRFGETLTESAKIADRLTVVRSVEHAFNNHIAGTYITLTGSTDQPNRDREAHGDDFPGPGAILNDLQTTPSPIPVSVSLPTWLSIPGPSNRMPGQYGGFLGAVRDPFLLKGDPNDEKYRPLALSLPDGLSAGRMHDRWQLIRQLDGAARVLEVQLTTTHDRLAESAYELVTDPRMREAVDLTREPQSMRERYGMTKIGQSLLLARRLVEVGVRLVGYNAFNQEWDTHGNLEKRYRSLIPGMDRAFTALVTDLDERGMLDETLVVNTGEFGRTPVINQTAGRDHWPDAYSTVLAGGGIRRGVVYGASDSRGAYVADNPVAPADLLATVWHQLGVATNTELHDRLGRPHRITSGRVLHELLA